MSDWQPIEMAPYSTPVEVVLEEGMVIVARLLPDFAMTEDDQSCDQWRAEYEGEHPPCWSGGACWDSNEDERMSLQPVKWRPANGFAETPSPLEAS